MINRYLNLYYLNYVALVRPVGRLMNFGRSCAHTVGRRGRRSFNPSSSAAIRWNVTVLRLFETVHGHLAVLAVAVLLHPAWLLRRGQRLSRGQAVAVAATVLLVVLAFASGLFVYGDYRSLVRAGLFRASSSAGLLFETKEHLAYGVVATTLGAATCAFLAPRDGKELRRAAATLFAIAAALCLATVALGSYVASVHGFGSR